MDFEITTTGAAIEIGELAERVPVGRSLRDTRPGCRRAWSRVRPRPMEASPTRSSISGYQFHRERLLRERPEHHQPRMGLLPVEVPFDFQVGGSEDRLSGRVRPLGIGGFVNAITKSGALTASTAA
ncbi:hypothetical protein ACRAWD_21445 [Caulobacter segnis]